MKRIWCSKCCSNFFINLVKGLIQDKAKVNYNLKHGVFSIHVELEKTARRKFYEWLLDVLVLYCHCTFPCCMHSPCAEADLSSHYWGWPPSNHMPFRIYSRSLLSLLTCEQLHPIIFFLLLWKTIVIAVNNCMYQSFITLDASDRDYIVRETKQYGIPVLNYLVHEGTRRQPLNITPEVKQIRAKHLPLFVAPSQLLLCMSIHTNHHPYLFLSILNEWAPRLFLLVTWLILVLSWPLFTLKTWPENFVIVILNILLFFLWQMKQLGIYSRLDQVFQAPDTVKDVLISQAGLDNSV